MSADLSLVIACYNEEPVLEDSVREIVRVLDFTRISYEIVFVDDASRDRTREILRDIPKVHPHVRMKTVLHEWNMGRGRAVADGIRAAEGGIVGFLDVDLEVHARYIPAFCLAIMGGAQAAVGARVFKPVWRGLVRRVLSAGYSALVHALLPVAGIADTEAGCKFFLRSAVLPVLDRVRDPGWFWDTELMVRSRQAGLQIVEVPCAYIRNPANRSSVRVVRDSATYLARLVAFRIRLFRETREAGGG